MIPLYNETVDLERLWNQRDALSFALQLAKNREVAEDLVAEARLKALRKLDTYHPEYNFRNWLFAIIRNCWRDEVRRRSRRLSTLALDNLDTLDLSLEFEDKLAPKPRFDERSAVNLALKLNPELPEWATELIHLIYDQGCSYQEAAEALGIKAGTVRSRLSRLRRQLSRCTIEA